MKRACLWVRPFFDADTFGQNDAQPLLNRTWLGIAVAAGA